VSRAKSSDEIRINTKFSQDIIQFIQVLEAGLKVARMIIERNLTTVTDDDVACADHTLAKAFRAKPTPRKFSQAAVTWHCEVILAAEHDQPVLFGECKFVVPPWIELLEIVFAGYLPVQCLALFDLRTRMLHLFAHIPVLIVREPLFPGKRFITTGCLLNKPQKLSSGMPENAIFSAGIPPVDRIIQAVGIGVDSAFVKRAQAVRADKAHEARVVYSVTVSERIAFQCRLKKLTIEC